MKHASREMGMLCTSAPRVESSPTSVLSSCASKTTSSLIMEME